MPSTDTDSPERLNEQGIAALRAGDWRRARQLFDAAIAASPAFGAAYNNRGLALRRLGLLEAACADFRQAAAKAPDVAAHHANLGHALAERKHYPEAIVHYRHALQCDPDFPDLLGTMLHTRMRIADWSGIETELATLAERLRAGRKLCPPFALLSLVDDPALHRCCAELTARNHPVAEAPAWPARPAGQRLRIGYFSGDFHNHASAYLIAELIELHNREHFEIIGFSLGPPRNDAMRRRLNRAFDRFIDLGRMNDAQAVTLARALQLDIAVDLAGYTTYHRFGLFARRLAPVQVAYLAYPGTTGSRCLDYLLADRTVLPTSEQVHYSERILHLPDCYQVNDRTRTVAERAWRRAEAGLPEGGFVYCCFNAIHKITPQIFAIWMDILKAVDGSVLWLLNEHPAAIANLRREAAAHGIDRHRLVFAGRLPPEQHLARHQLADLFLDTQPYNAHTTASDALRVGVPILTYPGRSFASRVASSLLQACDLQALIVSDMESYRDRAIAFGQQPALLQGYREHLRMHPLRLFDTDAFRMQLEAIYCDIARPSR